MSIPELVFWCLSFYLSSTGLLWHMSLLRQIDWSWLVVTTFISPLGIMYKKWNLFFELLQFLEIDMTWVYNLININMIAVQRERRFLIFSLWSPLKFCFCILTPKPEFQAIKDPCGLCRLENHLSPFSKDGVLNL